MIASKRISHCSAENTTFASRDFIAEPYVHAPSCHLSSVATFISPPPLQMKYKRIACCLHSTLKPISYLPNTPLLHSFIIYLLNTSTPASTHSLTHPSLRTTRPTEPVSHLPLRTRRSTHTLPHLLLRTRTKITIRITATQWSLIDRSRARETALLRAGVVVWI